MKLVRENILLILIIVIAVVVRFVGLDYAPASLNWDEVSHGYNAYSILTTGKDEWGVNFPMIFRAYGDYKLPVYIYLTAVSEAIFGLTPFAVRFVSALAGTFTVILSYFLVGELGTLGGLGKNKNLALTTAFLVAIVPWTVHLSRGAYEANLALTFIVAGVYCFLRFINSQYSIFIILSSMFFGLSVWTYNSARVFVPLFVAVLIFLFRNELRKSTKIRRPIILTSLFMILLFFLPMFVQLANPVGSARYDKVAILDDGAINKIVEARNSSDLPPFLARAVNNKVTYFGAEFAKNYVSHFNPSFLYFTGGSQYQFSIQGFGLLLPINLPFFLYGLYLVFKRVLDWSDVQTQRRRKRWLVLFAWLFLAPIASSFTREAPHVLRFIVVLPIPMIITAVGLVKLHSKLKKKYRIFAVAIYLFLMFLSLVNIAISYATDYRNNYSWSFQYGYEQVVSYVKDNYNGYDQIIVTKKYGEPHEFFLFYLGYDAEKYNSDPELIRFAQSDWFWVDGFDKFKFVNDWQIAEEGTGNYTFNLESGREVDCSEFKCLLITSPSNVPEGWRMLESIDFLDGGPAFEIYNNLDGGELK